MCPATAASSASANGTRAIARSSVSSGASLDRTATREAFAR
jgi:hypothetical protein